MLTTERVRGFSISDFDAIARAGLDRNALMEKASRAFFNQVFRDGFFHADMHPGNLFVLPDGRLAPVDFGIMGRIDEADQLVLARILWAFLQGDYAEVAPRPPRGRVDPGAYRPQRIRAGGARRRPADHGQDDERDLRRPPARPADRHRPHLRDGSAAAFTVAAEDHGHRRGRWTAVKPGCEYVEARRAADPPVGGRASLGAGAAEAVREGSRGRPCATRRACCAK
ncbi:MAG: AarF/UbiB family protein [Alphaproteobacteria bacterium]